MGASKYIYTVYDAKTGEYVAKGTAAQLAGKGIFKDAGSVSTCYLSNRKTDKPRRWRMERVEVGPLSAREAGFPLTAPSAKGGASRSSPKGVSSASRKIRSSGGCTSTGSGTWPKSCWARAPRKNWQSRAFSAGRARCAMFTGGAARARGLASAK